MQHANRARHRPTFEDMSFIGSRSLSSKPCETAVNHHAEPIGVCASAPDVRQGALGGRRARLDGVNSCFGSGGALVREFGKVLGVDTPGFLSCHTLVKPTGRMGD